MTRTLSAGTDFAALFKQARPGLPGDGLPWLSRLREEGLARFAALGYPTAWDEDWRFTPAAPIANESFALPEAIPQPRLESLAGLALCPFDFYRLVFVNGRYVPALSFVPELPRGARVEPLSRALARSPEAVQERLGRLVGAEGPAFAALNAALFSDGAFVLVPQGAALDHPVHLIFASSALSRAAATHARALVVVEDGARACVIEEHLTLDSDAGGPQAAAFMNFAAEAFVGENAGLSWHRLQREGERALHVSRLDASLSRDARFISHAVSLGGALVRNDLRVLMDGEGTDCALNGLYLARGRQHVDNHALVDHAKPRGTSRALYKGVLDGKARAVFNGLVWVRPNAQKTDAQVYNKNLLLSEEGLVNTKPEFKIFANDVQCKHGGTIGQLSPDALFYLRSRALGADEARRLLIHAFASEMVERIKVPALRDALSETLHRRLPEGVND